jgi:ligand-binding sensor domain-containing protein
MIMNKHIYDMPLNGIILIVLTCLPLPRLALADNLRIEPAAPIIAVGESISLSVLGAKGEIIWQPPQAGDIQIVDKNTALYTAPNEVGQYYVPVLEMNGSNRPRLSGIQVTVYPKEAAKLAFSREKSVWEVFTNRSTITGITLSETGETLWVSTQGGLEKRDATTGKLLKLFTNLDGLPDNLVSDIVTDDQGGLWIGTGFGGIAHLNNHGQWQVFNRDNSELPENTINALVNDGEGGVWIATGMPLNEEMANLAADQFFNGGDLLGLSLVDKLLFNIFSENGLFDEILDPSDPTTSVPTVTEASNEASETILIPPTVTPNNASTQTSSSDPNDLLNCLFNSDDPLGIFGSGSEDDVFNCVLESISFNSLMPENNKRRQTRSEDLFTGLDDFIIGDNDSLTGLDDFIGGNDLIGILCGNNLLSSLLKPLFLSGSQGGLAHLSAEGKWKVYHTHNSPLPDNIISDIKSDGQGGLWIGTYRGGLVHLTVNDEWQVYNTSNSALPDNFIHAIFADPEGDLWIGTACQGLAHLSQDGKWKHFNPEKFGLPKTISEPVSDGKGGVWFGTQNVLSKTGGLLHLNSQGELRIFNTANSELPNDVVLQLRRDGQNGLWIGTQNGLAHFNSQGNWRVFNSSQLGATNVSNTTLSDNFTRTIVKDEEGGLWIGTGNGLNNNGGLVHFNGHNEWTIFNVDNSQLPHNEVWALAIDNEAGLWIGTLDGLAYKNDQAEWTIYNTANSGLPNNSVLALLYDEMNQGIWIATGGGLAYLTHDGKWSIDDIYHSDLPENMIMSLLSDGKGGIWIGTGLGLAHKSALGQWSVYNINNSKLPHNLVNALLSDGQDGLWIATGTTRGGEGGLAHLSDMGVWTVYTQDNLPILPSNVIKSLASDGSGGVWVGTLEGLLHRSLRGDWTVFNTTNSGLPSSLISGLMNDGRNGLWVLSWGLAHLTFSHKDFLCEKVPDITDEQCAAILKGNRAAIVIHPNGIGTGYEQDTGVDNMATHVYQTLFLRGYDHDEIYYIAHKPNLDFNGDEVADSEIVDAPMTLETFRRDKKPVEALSIKHLQAAFEWAKSKHHGKVEGVPEEPLVVVFVDHGLHNKLMLNLDEELDELEFKALLDDYQTETGNSVVIIIEACHSGTLIDALQAPDRLIITSTDDKVAYYMDVGLTSFTRFYFDDLYRGAHYPAGLAFVKNNIFSKIGEPFNHQEPQLKGAGQIVEQCLNDCYGQLHEPEIIPEGLPPFLSSSNGSIELAVNIIDHDNYIDSVLVSVIRPSELSDYNEHGFEINKPLFIEELTQAEAGRWFTRFNQFTEQGEYHFIFRVKYDVRNGKRTVSSLEPVTVDFQSCQRHAYYNVDNKTLHLPAIKMLNENGDEALYQADYVVTHLAPMTFELKVDSRVGIRQINSACLAQFDPSTNTLSIPAVDIMPNENGLMETFYVELQRVSEKQFTLKQVMPLK